VTPARRPRGWAARRAARPLVTGLVAVLGWSAARPATAAAQSAADTAAPRVYLLTMGQGDEIWARFGHNALVIRRGDDDPGIAWNWGLFDFASPDLLSRFLTGDTRYWMAGQDVPQTLQLYQMLNRSLWLQELALTPEQARALDAAVRVNAREDRKYYRYDYFRDNCSTRVRDALDAALGGALRAQLAARDAGTTYRRETLRLLAGALPAAAGVDVALGAHADVPLTEWEAAFVPMNLRDALRRVRVPDGAGGTRPLVAEDRPLFVATRPPEAVNPPRLAVGFAAMGLGLALLLVALGRAAAGGGASRLALSAIGAIWSLAAGIVGVVLLLAATVTRHAFWGANANLLLFTPLSLALVALVPLALHGRRAASTARGLALGVLAVAALAPLAQVVTGPQPLAAPLALAIPVHAALYLALRRATMCRPA
jgi:hypothetical protein